MHPAELFNPGNRSDVRKLGLETAEAKPELRFDPERDIPEEQWKKMYTSIETARKNATEGSSDWKFVIGCALNIKHLDPNFDFPLSQEERTSYIAEREEFSEKNPRYYAMMVEAEQVLWPSSAIEPPQDVAQRLDFEALDVRNGLWHRVESLANLITIKPSYQPHAKISENDIQIEIRQLFTKNAPWDAAIFARNAIQISPEIWLDITDEDWESMNAAAKNISEGPGMFDLARLYDAMNSIAQHKAKQLTGTTESPLPLPEVKNF